jgi:hypothetical protein
MSINLDAEKSWAFTDVIRVIQRNTSTNFLIEVSGYLEQKCRVWIMIAALQLLNIVFGRG